MNDDSGALMEVVEILENLVLCKRCAHAQTTWTAIIGLALLLEAEGLRGHRGHTLSHSTRSIFRTTSNTGKVIFTIGWTALYLWYGNHVLREPGGKK